MSEHRIKVMERLMLSGDEFISRGDVVAGNINLIRALQLGTLVVMDEGCEYQPEDDVLIDKDLLHNLSASFNLQVGTIDMSELQDFIDTQVITKTHFDDIDIDEMYDCVVNKLRLVLYELRVYAYNVFDIIPDTDNNFCCSCGKLLDIYGKCLNIACDSNDELDIHPVHYCTKCGNELYDDGQCIKCGYDYNYDTD